MNTAERIGNFRTGRGDNSSPESRKTGAEQPSTGLLLLGGMLGVVCSGFFLIAPRVGGQVAAIGALTAAAASCVVTLPARRNAKN